MSETVEPQAITAPPHPKAVFLMLKTAYRRYVAGGTAANITIVAPGDFVHTAAKGLSGVVTVASGVPLPASCSVAIRQGATTTTTIGGVVSSPSGAWSATIPANTLAAGAYTAVASISNPVASVTSPTFNVT